MKRIALMLGLTLGLAAPAFADNDHDHHVTAANGIRIQHVWTAAGEEPALIRLEVINDRDAEVVLTGAKGDFAARILLTGTPLSASDNRMIDMEAVTIPAGRRLDMAPGGIYLRAEVLAAPLAIDAHHELHLHLDGNDITVGMEVLPPGTTRHPHAGHDH